MWLKCQKKTKTIGAKDEALQIVLKQAHPVPYEKVPWKGGEMPLRFNFFLFRLSEAISGVVEKIIPLRDVFLCTVASKLPFDKSLPAYFQI